MTNNFQTDLTILPLNELIKNYCTTTKSNKNNQEYLSGVVLIEIYDRNEQKIYPQARNPEPTPAQVYGDQPQLLKQDISQKTNRVYYYKEFIIKIELNLKQPVAFNNEIYTKLAIIGPSKWFAEPSGQFIWWKIPNNFVSQLQKGFANQWFANLQSQLANQQNPFNAYQYERGGKIERVLLLNNYNNIAHTQAIPTYQPKSVDQLLEHPQPQQLQQDQQIPSPNPTISQNPFNQPPFANPSQVPPQTNYQTNPSLAGNPQAFDQYQVQFNPNDPKLNQ